MLVEIHFETSLINFFHITGKRIAAFLLTNKEDDFPMASSKELQLLKTNSKG